MTTLRLMCVLVFTCRAPPECYVYSISEGRPHPAVGPHPFRITFSPVSASEGGSNDIEDLQIFGDVIAWSITDDNQSAVHVWNWRTSVLVWVRTRLLVLSSQDTHNLHHSTIKAALGGRAAG